MKTRVVYPQLWLDEKFVLCSLETKVLFNYLINNIYLNLSRYSRISDRKIKFETGLTDKQLAVGKKELTDLKWCFFHEEWIYHNHECAYVDYEGNLKVQVAKAKEIDQIPSEIKGVFKGLAEKGVGNKKTPTNQKELNPLATGSRLDINHKSETINHKSEIGEGSGMELLRTTLKSKGMIKS